MPYPPQQWANNTIAPPYGPTSAERFTYMENGIQTAQATAEAAEAQAAAAVSLAQSAATLSVVTSLPASASDGAQNLLYSSANGGSLWYVRRYNGIWYVVGGNPIYSGTESGTSFGADSGSAWHSPAGEPLLTIPFAGTYQVRWGANMSTGAAGAQYKAGLQLNGGAAGTTDDYVQTVSSAGGTNPAEAVSRAKRKTYAAGDTVSIIYRSTAATGTNYSEHRFIEITPVTL